MGTHTSRSRGALPVTLGGALILILPILGCGSSEPQSSETESESTAGQESALSAEAEAPEPEEPVAHHPDTRWPDAPHADARFHLILHPIDINTEGVHDDAVAEIDQFFIDRIHAELPQVFVGPPGTQVPDGLLGYVLDPAIEVVRDSPDRCHVEVQLILETHDGDLRADIPSAASAVEGEGVHRQQHAVRGAFQGALQLLPQALEHAAIRDGHR